MNPSNIKPMSRQRGVALVLTLLIVSMLVVVVVGFTTVVRVEQVGARNATYRNSATQLAQKATSDAMAQLLAAIKDGESAGIYATQPGQLLRKGAPPLPLYSPGTDKINANLLTTKGLITGNKTDVVDVGLEAVNDASGNPIGRVAYYIDDESTKIPVNQATGKPTTQRTLNPQWPRPFSIEGATDVATQSATKFNNIINSSQNPKSIDSWNYFFTPEQLRHALPDSTLHQLTVAEETNSILSNKTPWGDPKVLINKIPISTAGAQQLATALSNPKLTEIFGQTFSDKYTPEGLEQLAANMLQLRTDHWRSNPDAPQEPPEPVRFDGVDQIIGTEDLDDPVETAPTAGKDKKTNGIPQVVMGYVPFPMIRHIAVGAVYGWTQQNRMSVKIFLECEIFNPFPAPYPGGGQIIAQIDKARFGVDFGDGPPLGWRGPDGSAESQTPHNDQPDWNPNFSGVWDPWGGGNPNGLDPNVNRTLDPLNGIQKAILPQIDQNSSETVFLDFTVTFDEGNDKATLPGPIYCIIDSVKILAEPNVANSIRDWCSGNDFFNALAASDDGPAQFKITAISGPKGSPSSPAELPAAATPNQKLVRLDPRMRPCLKASEGFPTNFTGKVWQQIDYKKALPGPNNFSENSIPSDKAFDTTNDEPSDKDIYNPVSPPTLSSNDGTYVMASELGKVFTGLPWRTLRIQPQPESESKAELIPDWALLDVIGFGDGNQALSSVNPNSSIFSSSAPVKNRSAAIRSQMNVLVGTLTTPLKLSHPIQKDQILSQSMNGSSVRLSSGNLTTVINTLHNLDNNASWASAHWRDRRKNNKLGFPENALLLPSEIVEVKGMADYNTTEGQAERNEIRINALFPGLATKSRFFRIYALGEALEGKPPKVSVAAKALLQTLVAVDTSKSPPIKIINQYPIVE
jgi:hypothetical protein